MTLPSTKTSTEPLPGNGITKTFDFDFKVWNVSQLAVWFKDGDDASVKLTENYTITLNPDQDTSPGGYVTYPVTGDPLTSSQFITVLRAMPFTQGINITEGQSFSAPVIMQALDQATAERQELREEISRSFSVVPGEDKPEDYLNQAEAARDASMGYASESMGYRDQSQGYASESMGYRDQSQTYANNSAASAAEAAATATALASEFPNAWPRHCLQSEGLGINVDATPDVQGNEVLSEAGTGASRSIDFGLDFTAKGGMFLGKNKNVVGNWFLGSTLTEAGYQLYTNLTSALTANANGIESFDSAGVNIGSDATINNSGSNIAEFAFQTTHEKIRKFENVKSVVFDFADNWGSASNTGVRSIEFYYQGTLLALTTLDFNVYVTSEEVSGNYDAENAFDTTLSKIGAAELTGWASLLASVTNQRLIVVFNTVQTFDRIVINNYHSSGTNLTLGVKNTKIYTSTDSITSTVYNETIANSELIFDGQIAQHVASNVIDDKYYTGVHWAYNPATGFFMLLHDGDSGSADFPIVNVTNKDVIFSSTKILDLAYNHHIYNIISGVQKFLYLDDTAAVASSTIFKEMSENNILFDTSDGVNQAGQRYFTFGFVGEDLGHITPGMWGAEGAVSTHKVSPGATYNCGIDSSNVKHVIAKRLNDASNWNALNSVSGLDKALFLNSTSNEITLSGAITFSGSELTMPPVDVGNWPAGDWLILVIGEDGEMPTGKTVNINADADNPACFTLASGYSALTGPKDYQISEVANKQLVFTEDDGLYGVYVDKDKNYTLGAVLPDFDSTPGVMKSPTGKLKWAEVQITDNTIVDLDLMPKGNYYIIAHIPGDASAVNILDNYFGCTKIDFTVYGTNDITGDIEYEEIAVTAKTINSSYFKFTNPGSVPAYLMIYVRRRW